MRYLFLITLLFLPIRHNSTAESVQTIRIQRTVSKSKTIDYTRYVRFDQEEMLYHVRDYFDSGQIQMEATYSALNTHIKEEYQCNYSGNTKEGEYREWHSNGNLRYSGEFENGLRHGLCIEFGRDGNKESESSWSEGRLHGTTRLYDKRGNLTRVLDFKDGINQNPRSVEYPQIVHTPNGYENDSRRTWPLIIYLHGGSERGSDLKKLYNSGIPDQIYRGRDLPFIVAAPQCPALLRWSTDDWFEQFLAKLMEKYRVDRNRVYLTGQSLGGSGTWYLAAKHPEEFAAIAPISGFTSHTTVIDANIDNLASLPIWAFHGQADLVVPVSETTRIAEKLKQVNGEFRITSEPKIGHWVHWTIYPEESLYEWFLLHEKSSVE